MPEPDSIEKHVKRKLLIAQLMQRAFRERPGSKSEMVWASDILEFSPLLRNPATFFVAVDRVREELSLGFELNTELFSQFETHELISFKIDDPKRLDKYVAEKELELAEVRKENSHHTFILDEEANLYLVGSDLSPYSIERGSLRHRLIYYLAKDGGYVSAAQLAEKVHSTPKRIRTTVGQLRDKVKERFDVPGTDLIQSRDIGSYRATSIQLKVPKGYTP